MLLALLPRVLIHKYLHVASAFWPHLTSLVFSSVDPFQSLRVQAHVPKNINILNLKLWDLTASQLIAQASVQYTYNRHCQNGTKKHYYSNIPQHHHMHITSNKTSTGRTLILTSPVLRISGETCSSILQD